MSRESLRTAGFEVAVLIQTEGGCDRQAERLRLGREDQVLCCKGNWERTRRIWQVYQRYGMTLSDIMMSECVFIVEAFVAARMYR